MILHNPNEQAGQWQPPVCTGNHLESHLACPRPSVAGTGNGPGAQIQGSLGWGVSVHLATANGIHTLPHFLQSQLEVRTSGSSFLAEEREEVNSAAFVREKAASFRFLTPGGSLLSQNPGGLTLVPENRSEPWEEIGD